MTAHPPEPWRAGEGSGSNPQIQDANGGDIFYTSTPTGIEWEPGVRERIVACVNACRGIPTEALEEIGAEDWSRSELAQAAHKMMQRGD